MVVNNITVPAFSPDAPDTKQLADAVRELLTNDIFAQFIGQIETDLKVSIDQDQLKQALGSGTQQ